MIKVAIVDDHQILNDTLRIILDLESDLELIGAATDLMGGRRLLQHSSPDVLLLDLHLPDGYGCDLISAVRKSSPRTRIVFLTDRCSDQVLMEAIEYDAAGLFSKDRSLEALLDMIRSTAAGEICIPPHLLVGALKRRHNKKPVLAHDDRLWEQLTSREMEVLHCLAQGKPGNAIAADLHITPFTVRTHIRNLMSKLGVHTRLEAVSFALSNGLVEIQC